MEVIVAVAIGLLASAGVFLMLNRRLFPVVVGFVLLSNAVNLFVFAIGGVMRASPPLLAESAPYADPLPQALVLTAIVIGFGMTATLIALAVWCRNEQDSDRVDAADESSGTPS